MVPATRKEAPGKTPPSFHQNKADEFKESLKRIPSQGAFDEFLCATLKTRTTTQQTALDTWGAISH